MEQVILVIGSVTRAQRAAELLTRQGIRCHLFRAPQQLSSSGCSYAVCVAVTQGKRAHELLVSAGLSIQGIYEKKNEEYREAAI